MDVNLKRSEKGFTLIELMIVLAIAAVLLTIAAPGLRNLLEKNRLQTGAESLYTSLMFTRSEALKRNQPVTLCKSSSGAACVTSSDNWELGWLVYVDQDGDSVPDPGEILRVSDGLKSGDTLRVTGTGFDTAVIYGIDGTVNGSETFVLCNADANLTAAREIGISVTGRVSRDTTTTDCTP